MIKPRFVNLCMITILLSMFTSFAVADNSDPINALVKPNAAEARLKSSPIFSGRGDGVKTCPVTGEKINNKNFKAQFHGRTVYFCCHGCLKAAKTAPDKFIKPTLQEQMSASNAFLAKAKQVDSAEFCNE